MSIERKSAAIMFTDIAGYTEAMSESEQKALDMLRRKRSILKPLIKNHQGTYVKEIGDGTLSYFESGYNASACAKEFQKEIGALELETVPLFALANKNLSKEYDEKEIHILIKEAENIAFELNLRLYELLEDTSYLKTAYNQVKEKADNLAPDVAAKFLSYSIPSAIVEEWKRVK